MRLAGHILHEVGFLLWPNKLHIGTSIAAGLVVVRSGKDRKAHLVVSVLVALVFALVRTDNELIAISGSVIATFVTTRLMLTSEGTSL